MVTDSNALMRIVAVVAVHPRPAAVEYVAGVAGRNVTAEAVTALAGPVRRQRIVIVMRIAIEDEVAAPVLNEQSRSHDVMYVQHLEPVVAPGDPHPPRLVVQVVVLGYPGDFETFHVNPARGHREAFDAARVLDPRKVEHGDLAWERPVVNRITRRPALRQRDPADVVRSARAPLRSRRVRVRARADVHGIARPDDRLRMGDGRPRRALRTACAVAAVRSDVVGRCARPDRRQKDEDERDGGNRLRAPRPSHGHHGSLSFAGASRSLEV